MPPPSIKGELEQLIRRGLDLRYVSESSHDRIQTGNHYQSVLLGGERTSGFRTPRTDFLDMIDFEGKRVLDLGSNLGEISREARARGAAVVDGFEHDPFFVELANAINAYNGVSRVSFQQRDITDPDVYVEEYDIVLGLSVFIYLQTVLDRLADITSGILVLETHKLNDNLEPTYLTPLSQHFAYHTLLGESDWGTHHSPEDVRAVLVLAKTRASLVGGLTVPVSPRATGGREDRRTSVDCRRTPWTDRFFSTFQAKTPDDLIAGIARMDIDLQALELCGDLWTHVMSGWAYWLLYVKGYVQYREAGGVTDDNVYARYMREIYPRGSHDADLVAQLERSGTAERLSFRFKDFEAILTAGKVSPVTLVVREEPPENGKVVYEHPSGAPLAVALVDGYHRLFAARLAGLDALPARIVFEEKRALELADGEIEHLRIEGDGVAVSGRITTQGDSVDGIELWLGETVLARTSTTRETAVAGEETGTVLFTLDATLRNAERRASELRLVTTKGWSPVGEIALR